MIRARRRRAGRSVSRAIAAACCACALVAAADARAEKADRDQPVHLEADRVTIDDAKQIAVFEGNVVLTQGTLVIRGERMEVRQDAEGFRSGTTWGRPAYFRQKREGYDEFIEGWAARIEYDGRTELMQMFEGARLRRGEDEVRGNYISYDGRSEFYRVIGGGDASPDNPSGRVRAVLQPKSKEKPASEKPASAPPLTLKPDASLEIPPRRSRERTR
jgi:lipopolysaccharide export system protein LptA